MLNHRVIVVLLAVAVAGSFAIAQQQGEPQNEALAGFLEEREKILREIVDLYKLRFEIGEVSWESVAAAEAELREAQLDAATTSQQRIEIREQQLVAAKKWESLAESRFEAGDELTEADLMPVRVQRLNAEIALLREKQGE